MSDSEWIRTEIGGAVRALLPFFDSPTEGSLKERVDAAPLDMLRRFYLFSVSGLFVQQDEQDIPRFIECRFQSLLSAAHRAGWTVLTAAMGSSSGVSIRLGFMGNSTSADSDPYVFERILRGLLPGLGVTFMETTTIESLLCDKTYGGIVAGVPVLKIDDERQRFGVPTVLRSMHGEDYVLMMISSPVGDVELSAQLRAVWDVKDRCHAIGIQQKSSESSEGKNWHEDESKSRSTSSTISAGASVIFANASYSKQTQEAKTKTVGKGGDKRSGESLSFEKQYSVAIELERLAGRHADRFMKAANIGEWETAITFATKTSAGRDILAGVILGELAKPSTDVFPPKVYYGNLDSDCPLLLPRLDSVSAVFPKSLASYLTSEELALIACPPVEQLPGYDVRRTPSLSLADAAPPLSDGQMLGVVCDHGRPLKGVHVHLGPADLAKHLFVCGLTGTGKTTTVKELLVGARVPFLVLESAKRDYRQLLGVDGLRDKLKIYTIGDGTVSPLSMNPFYVMPGVSALAHIDFLKAIFNASFSLYGPMPYILEKCIHNIYLKRGWNLTTGQHPHLCDKDGDPEHERYRDAEAMHLFPTLVDLKDEVQDYVRTALGYRGELSDNIRTAIVTRLESLSVGSKGLLFGTNRPLDLAALLGSPTILELEALSDDDDKAFFVGMILTFISEYRQINNPDLNPFAPKEGALAHLLVIEEAHRLLKNVTQERQTEQLGNPKGKALEFFANAISEMRAMGQGVVVVEQIPSKILPDVIKNTNVKIVHRLVAGDDQTLIASSLGLQPEEALYLTSLTTGHALYMKEGMQRPVEVAVNASVSSTRISHERVKKAMKTSSSLVAMDDALRCEIRSILLAEGDAVALQTLCTIAAESGAMPEEVVNMAMASINRMLLIRDQRFSSELMAGYLSNRIVSLLVLGVFRITRDDFQNITAVVDALLGGGKDKNAAKDFLTRLEKGWGDGSLCEGLVFRISALVFDRAVRAGLKSGNRDDIRNITLSYFLFDVPDVREKIVSRVVVRLGGG